MTAMTQVPVPMTNGAIKRMQRYGRKTNGTYGLTDDLTVTLDGNRPMAVSDAAGTQVYNGSFDFKDHSGSGTEYTYSNGGAVLTDANKGIAMTGYDKAGYPRRIQFTNANVTEFSYDADGRKWKTVHRTAVANLSVPSGSTLALDNSNTQSEDSTEYIGCFIRENGTVAKYLFDGGYCTFSSGGVPALHFYTLDHLGNVREVVSESGTVEQVTHYYPFGGVFGDAGTGSAVQKYKYNGKELDRTHGLDTYDYGARMYDAALPIWDRPDPFAEKYYHLSPYVYCANNPVNLIDLYGKKILIPKKSQPSVLQMINLYSKTQYKVDAEGFMCIDKDAGINEIGSAHYSERLNATISAKGVLTIRVGDKYTASDGKVFKTYDVNKKGGGLTDKTTKTNIKTVVSEKGHIVHDSNGNELKKSAAEVLIHEIVGHAAPAIAGTETGNAVKNENIVRKELLLPEREDEESHHE